ncbi:hypothetical protein [Pedobacter faecalis]|uniref:hypothetical protein n=1 Tax=Pedobacter faecalis TaxID=3041495 RepID=UPI00254C4EB9|nr:hypothetical protein [Pedobacter sp. ELA7]
MMNQTDIFRKIGGILNELQDQYEFLAQNPEQLNELELELFLANADFLSDHVQIVRKLNHNKPVKQLAERAEPEIAEVIQEPERVPVIDEPLEPGHPTEAPKDYAFFERPEELVKFVAEEPAATFEFVMTDRREPGESEVTEQPKPEHHEEVAPIQEYRAPLVADKPEEKQIPEPVTHLVPDKPEEKIVTPAPTLNDLLSARSAKAENERDELAKPAVQDLKKAITLNEKLLYIKDLFNGYNLAYSEAIDLINKMPDFETADTFLRKNYAEKNNWQAKQSTVDKFYELLNQRFPKG